MAYDYLKTFTRYYWGGAVISRAIASDLYKGNELTKFLSLLMLVNGVARLLRLRLEVSF